MYMMITPFPMLSKDYNVACFGVRDEHRRGSASAVHCQILRALE